MIKKLPQSQDNIIGFAIIGELTEEDYEMMDAEMARVIDAHGSVRLLYTFDQMDGFELSAAEDDARIGFKYLDNIERMAVVSDQKLFDWLTSAADFATGTELRHFSTDKKDTAWAWLA